MVVGVVRVQERHAGGWTLRMESEPRLAPNFQCVYCVPNDAMRMLEQTSEKATHARVVRGLNGGMLAGMLAHTVSMG